MHQKNHQTKSLDIDKSRALFISVILGVSIIIYGFYNLSKIDVNILSFFPFLYLAGVLIPFSIYCHIRKMISLAVGLEVLGFGFFITFPIITMTYIVVGFNFPLADAQLDSMDKALGFNWISYIHYIDARPFIAKLFLYVYQSFFYQMILVPIILVVSGKLQRAYAMISAYALLCLSASLIAMFFPALGTYAYYGVTAHALMNINPHFAWHPVRYFLAVRNQARYTLTLGNSSGLLCFPSVHAGVACLCTWACWETRWARYPMLLLNVLMTASAVACANHYFIDIVAGLGTSSLWIAVVSALFLHRPTLAAGKPSRSPSAERRTVA